MTPSEIAEWLENAGWSTAAATIRELEKSEREVRDFASQVCEANEVLQANLKIAAEALEGIVHTAREMVGTAVDTDAAYAWAVGLKATTDEANQALTRIREAV